MFNFLGASSSAGGAIVLVFFLVIFLAFVVFEIAAIWKVYAKAGQPGWASFVPLYNLWIELKVANRPGWWFLLFLIPGVNFVVAIIVLLDIAKSFGKSELFGVGMFFFGFIFWPILGFGDATYTRIER